MLERDEILLERIKNSDDQKAFEYLYHFYYSSLCAYCIGFIKNHADAEDLINDCFFELWKNRKTVEIRTSLKAYLYVSARNKSINHLKKNILKQRYVTDQSYPLAFQQEITSQTEQLMAQENLEEKLKKAIEQLPAQCRHIFYMNRFEGLKYKEIAKRLNLTEATIKTQIARALKNLRSDLENLRNTLLLFLGIYKRS